MELLKNYSYTKGRSLWRLLPAGPNLLVIEERDNISREAFYSCIEMSTGKFIINDYQTEEKTWSGIEEIFKGFIYFHKYAKPDMPIHTGIIAYNIYSGEKAWENSELTFSFIAEEKVYCYKTMFEGRKYFELDFATGEILRELGEDVKLINTIYTSRNEDAKLEGYRFPETYIEGKDSEIDEIITSIKVGAVISGKIDMIKLTDSILISYHTVNDDGTLTNRFNSIDITTKKTILEVILNRKISAYIPDSYFISNDLLFLLIEKEQLVVYLMN